MVTAGSCDNGTYKVYYVSDLFESLNVFYSLNVVIECS